MTGSTSRRKGARFELDVAHKMQAEKISAMYRTGPDLEWNGYFIECKRFKAGTKKLYDALAQHDDTSIVVHRADREATLITMDLSTFLDIVDEAKGAS